MDDYTHFFGLYKTKLGDDDVRVSMLNMVNRRHPQRFPVTLKRIFNSDKTIEVIEEKSDILEIGCLELDKLDWLKDQIMYLVHDMLIWYKKRVKLIIPSCDYDAKLMEEQGFIPFLSGADYMDISISISFYEKKEEEEYIKKEEREVLRYNKLFCDGFAFGVGNEEKPDQEEFHTRRNIESCLSYELRKAWPETIDGLREFGEFLCNCTNDLPNYADFCITYKLKREDRPHPLYTRPGFRDLHH